MVRRFGISLAFFTCSEYIHTCIITIDLVYKPVTYGQNYLVFFSITVLLYDICTLAIIKINVYIYKVDNTCVFKARTVDLSLQY